MRTSHRVPLIPPRGPSGVSRPSQQPHFTLDVMEFLEESKRIERHKAREQLLEAVERVSVTKARDTHSYQADFGGLEDRSVHDIKHDMIAAVKSVLG